MLRPWGTGVGFSCDFNRDGFLTGLPTAFSGDYFLPGTPMEGVTLSWRTISNGPVSTAINKGRMGKYGGQLTGGRGGCVCFCSHVFSLLLPRF